MPNLPSSRMDRLPPYVLSIVNELKLQARKAGEDIIDLGMGNPDLPTPKHIVDKLVEASRKTPNHRYSASRGIHKLRLAICNWYRRRYNVHLDPNSEAVVTIGAKEGLAHLVFALLRPGEHALVPTPTYPIHAYSVVLAGGNLLSVPLVKGVDFLAECERVVKSQWPRPRLLIISFPHNPTTAVVDLAFFQKVVQFAREYDLYVIHDLAYADLVFDGYSAPSFLQVEGAKDVGVEFFSLSKSYNMPGWRVGFCVGNPGLIQVLTRIKSYLDYGVFQPIQIAGIVALNGDQMCVEEIRETYRRRRDTLVDGLARIGWAFEKPTATMFVWAPLPERFRTTGSVEFSKLLLREARVAVSPGLGFGEYGEGYVRFALVENEHRIRQAVRGIKRVLTGEGAQRKVA
ncbi:MAG: aminotransferase class I/II-fold pyridoxal phosphate-dependent enzyme [Nitrospirae bacterium]|nr:aminotransferase class I/II-fold pyridoxal phosphate-dependent enzyme [Nitrospirota bacterium]